MLHLQGVEALVLLVHGFHGLALLQGANRHEWDPLPGFKVAALRQTPCWAWGEARPFRKVTVQS